VVLASEGYPDTAAPNRPLHGIAEAEQVAGVEVCVAAATNDAGQLVANGGRVLSVVATGSNFADARTQAYAGLAKISLEGSHHRTDIAAKVVEGLVN
jgi:phosphoribosylamine--glycine ligase